MSKKKIHLEKALESFVSDQEALRKAVASSTKAGYGGSGYSVELFPDGHYRVLWNSQIGNKYFSPGIILAIPQLPDDYDEEAKSEEERGEAWIEALYFYAPEFADVLRDNLQSRLERPGGGEAHLGEPQPRIGVAEKQRGANKTRQHTKEEAKNHPGAP